MRDDKDRRIARVHRYPAKMQPVLRKRVQMLTQWLSFVDRVANSVESDHAKDHQDQGQHEHTGEDEDSSLTHGVVEVD
jgi:hypothetical protein